ncbi:MAG TPA: hypothetical protein VFN01_00615 [Marinobacter sp.]|uniref:hypothetical protein n=1 Tax=Marinobacter sp. TaxID=50741 RepID=UPI002D7FCC07|nr:hypothetical protein [Marinobacter sp.]HET8799660.1 hypothetical protein [Marinobacter sp.]
MQVIKEPLFGNNSDTSTAVPQLNSFLDLAAERAVDPVAAADFAHNQERGFLARRRLAPASTARNSLLYFTPGPTGKRACETEELAREVNPRRRIIKRQCGARVGTRHIDARLTRDTHQKGQQFLLFLVVNHTVGQHGPDAGIQNIGWPLIRSVLVCLQPVEQKGCLSAIHVTIGQHPFTQTYSLIHLAINNLGPGQAGTQWLAIVIQWHGTAGENSHAATPLQIKSIGKVKNITKKIAFPLTQGKFQKANRGMHDMLALFHSSEEE